MRVLFCSKMFSVPNIKITFSVVFLLLIIISFSLAASRVCLSKTLEESSLLLRRPVINSCISLSVASGKPIFVSFLCCYQISKDMWHLCRALRSLSLCTVPLGVKFKLLKSCRLFLSMRILLKYRNQCQFLSQGSSCSPSLELQAHT